MGHNGTDPGVRTAMLASLDKRIGVVVFTNTSLTGQEQRRDAAIFLELWKHAEVFKN